MRKRPTTTWIIVVDGSRGRFFRPNEETKKLESVGLSDMVAPQARQRPRDLKSDKPGRGYSSSRSGVRHAFEPAHDYHKLEKHRFMAKVASTLDEACERREFDDLIIVAPRRSLGELRELLSKRVQSRVRREVAKDLTNEPAGRLWRRLNPIIRPTT